MPFTFSHPALVLPVTFLPEKWYSLTGLIIGSMTPDFEYFIRMNVQSHYSHTVAGIFYFDLPVGIISAFIFHNLIRNSLYENLPEFLKVRLTSFKNFDWNRFFIKNWIPVTTSIIIGAASHLLWDSFTHKSGYFVEALAGLSANVNLFGYQFPLYNILQHSGTVIGGIILLYSLLRLPVHSIVVNSIDFRYWLVVIFVTFIIMVIRYFTGLDIRMIDQVIVTLISATLISLTVTPILI